ncbi:methyl-accepting chemotaxis protein [Azospirillum sp.]|uniref:methyl-accepting chemotaxis protein n=1 Tax=Azospirillum sp. TaxID=34012 RepID=UPI002D3CC676|nr:cache domain-containing protein [Azospirillum sp.]HYD69108.1 cache domain-containing protein [Azospirillum sp.]
MGIRDIGIRLKFLILSASTLLALVAVAGVLLMALRDAQVEDSRSKVQAIVETAVGIVNTFEQHAAKGEMPVDQAKAMARTALRAMRYGGGEYIFVQDLDGQMEVNGGKPELEGKNVLGLKDPSGVFFVREMIALAQKGGGFVGYVWPKAGSSEPVPKVAYTAMTPGWKWVVGTGVYTDNIDADFREHALEAGLIGTLLAGAALALAFAIAHSISRPIAQLTGVMNRLAEDDFTVEVPDTTRGDEIGTMAKAVSVFKEHGLENRRLREEQEAGQARAAAERRAMLLRLAEEFERKVGAVVERVAASAGSMHGSATALSSTAETALRRATDAADAAEEASASVNTVAGATEELTASIQEIARQVSTSSAIAAQAVQDAEKTNALMSGLAEAASQVGEVVNLINTIAGQTNLLALNATIEAARAGEHGKGFAVVASEVKGLANQTARATEEIQAKIGEIQHATDAAVSAIRGVGDVIGQMNAISGAIAAAIEQQGAATQDIAGNIQQAAVGARAVSDNVTGVNRASAEAGAAAEQVCGGAGELARAAEQLRGEVAGFLQGIRAA